MTSKTIYSHVPYFYIIEHILSGKKYGGAKWAKDANPATFMVEGGYTTSSNVVNDLIVEDGLDSFVTRLIMTAKECEMPVYEYETIFLQHNNIAGNADYLNMHNNDGIFPFGSDNYTDMIFKKFGVTNASKLKWVKEKKSITCMSNFNVDNPSKSDIVKTRKSDTCLKHFGEDHHMKSQVGKDLLKAGMLDKHGVDHNMKLPEVQIKRANTLYENFGVAHAFQSPIIRAKGKATCLENMV